MKHSLRYLLAVLVLLWQNYSNAQDKTPVKFGKISPADFDLSAHQYDSSAPAVVIADVGSTTFTPDNKGFFNLMFKTNKRIKIINKNGFDAAKEMIVLYQENGNEERLERLKATTYNLEGGKVVATELDSKSIFKDKLDKNHTAVKFTLPAVKEGSVIEISYTQTSPLPFQSATLEFPVGVPILWSEYSVEIPQYFDYVFLSRGYIPYYKHIQDSRHTSFMIRDNSGTGASELYNADCMLAMNRWIIKDVPAIKEEAFTSSLSNHISGIEFQYRSFRPGNGIVRPIMDSWEKASEELMQKNEQFGADLEKGNGWLDEELQSVLAGVSNNLEKAQRIFAHVRDHYTCNDHSGYLLTENLRSAFKKKGGSVADVNLLLVAMLIHAGVEAHPVLLSTTEHGRANPFYPLMNRYNYVVVETRINDKLYYLDASIPNLGFNKLPVNCYNGPARSLSKGFATPIAFIPDSLKERKVTSVFLFKEKDGKLTGNVTKNLGYYESLSMRNAIRKEGEEAYVKRLSSSYTDNFHAAKHEFDSLRKVEEPVRFKYTLDLSFEEDVVYFQPLLDEAMKENPFKAADRIYPVEMPYAFDETYVLSMDIPEGYKVEELPKSARVNFGDNEGGFEYMVAKDDDKVQLRVRLRFSKATFIPEDYADLREFYAYIVKKHAEPIVFKKVKS